MLTCGEKEMVSFISGYRERHVKDLNIFYFSINSIHFKINKKKGIT